MTLYLKYRPQTIEELDLEKVRKQIRSLAASGERMPHAFLFSGPKGTGKTSAARILAKLINCEAPVKTKEGLEPCNSCSSCRSIAGGQSVDVIEMDAASNRGIDDIRSLRESIALAPAVSKKKIYIIDEAHMLTTEASNAFLKTLEEPPAHVVFILATTDAHKLPATVHSRLAPVSFYKATAKEIARPLNRIIKSEKLKLKPEVVESIASRADGSLRDAVKMLENLVLTGELPENLAETEELLKYILAKDTGAALALVRKYSEAGGSISHLIDEMQLVLRSEILAEVFGEEKQFGGSRNQNLKLLKLLMEAKASLGKVYTPQLALELAVIENSPPQEDKTVAAQTASRKAKVVEARKVKIKKVKSKKKAINTSIDADVWREILDKLRNKNASLEALLRNARVNNLKDSNLELAVFYRFHKERLETDQYRRMLEGAAEEVLGVSPVHLTCVLEDPPPAIATNHEKAGLTPAQEKDIIQAAEEIFGE